MSLRVRFALSSAALILIALAIAGLGARASTKTVATEDADRFLSNTVQRIRDPLETGDYRELADSLGIDRECLVPGRHRPPLSCDQPRLTPEIAATRIIGIDNNGDPFVAYNNFGSALSGLNIDVRSLNDPQFHEFSTVEIENVQLRVVMSNLETGVAIQVVRDLDDVGSALSGLLRQMALFGAIGAGAAALVGWLLARNATRPIEQLTATAERVAQTQDLSERIPTERTDEVGRLAGSFNTMLEALDTSRHQQERLVQDANHELRTPLTSLRTNIELLERAPNLDENDRANLLQDVKGELNELTALVEELVESATDVASTTEPFQQVALEDLVESVAELARRRTGRIVSIETINPDIVNVRVSMIERAIRNLVSNAAKFSPDTTPINVRVDRATVEVTDHGPGIAVADREQVFKRFYRSDRDRSAPGSGLGLSIVKQIVDAHGGQVWANSAPTGGASVGFDISAASVVDESVV